MKAINMTKIIKTANECKRVGAAKADKTRYVASEAFLKASANLATAINEAEGRASARCITVTDIIEELTAIERGLRIPKKSMVGISVVVDVNAQDFPNAYKYTPTSTWFCAEYTSTGWKVTDIYRGDTARYNAKYRIKLTDEAKARIIENYEYGFRNI